MRDAGPAITPGDCPIVKGLNTTQGSLGLPLTLSSGSAPCFFTDPESAPETIYAGQWSASLDLSTSTGTVLNITFAVTAENGTSPALICFWNQSTTGGTDQSFSCNGGNVSIDANQRIRLRVEFVSGLTIVLSYDGSVATQNSSIIVPVPEFGDFLAPVVITGILVLVLSSRRRRSTE